MQKQYTLRGFEYHIWEDIEEDNIKIFHYCFKDGREIKMPAEFYNHSPYSLITPDEFAEFINTVEVFVQS